MPSRFPFLPGAVLLTAALSAVGPLARGDDVWAGSPGRRPLKYSAVEIRGDQDGVLAFRAKGGNLVYKPIEQVVRVHVDRQADLNQAEELYEAADYASAIELYESVAGKAEQTWLKRLATARLIVCYDVGGRFGDAVQAWVATLKIWPSYALSHRPVKPGEKGSKANKQALDALSAAAKNELAPAAMQAIKDLQSAVWKAEGDSRGTAPGKAGQPDAESSGRPRGEQQASTSSGTVDVVSALGKATRLAEDGHYDRALTEINGAIAGVSERHRQAYVPRLLALKAQCLLAQGDKLAAAKKTDEARLQYVYGGLAAMQVVASFPESPSFVECLYLTGQCHEKIGRTKLAVSLYQECKEFAIGRKHPKLERLATQALERLDAKTK